MGILILMDRYIKEKFGLTKIKLGKQKTKPGWQQIVTFLTSSLSAASLILRLGLTFTAVEIASEVTKVLPIVGSAIGSTVSFSFTLYAGNKLVALRKEEALQCYKISQNSKLNLISLTSSQNNLQ